MLQHAQAHPMSGELAFYGQQWHRINTAALVSTGFAGVLGVQDLTQLQQQLQSLADNQAELAKEVAALKQSSPIPAGTSPSDTAATATPSFASIGDTAAPNTSEGSNSPAAGTALSPDASDPASGVQLVGNMAAQLSALTAEVGYHKLHCVTCL